MKTKQHMDKKQPEKKIYKSNYLTDVIFQINFSQIKDIAETLPDKIKTPITEIFPIAQEQIIHDIFVQDSKTGGFSAGRQEKRIWTFKNKEGDCIVDLISNSLSIREKKYTRHSEFNNKIIQITNILFREYPDLLINRTGLRYINQIKLAEKDIFNWETYINKKLVSNIDFSQDKSKVKRLMSVLEFSPDADTDLRFQYGMYNSLYPNRIIKKEFVLDYDCYTKINYDKKDITEKIKQFNECIWKCFEDSITDEYRNHLDQTKGSRENK